MGANTPASKKAKGNRAEVYRLRYDRVMSKYRRWTKAEDQKLIKLYDELSLKELGKLFDRNPAKVCRRAIRLDLKKSRESISKHLSESLTGKINNSGSNNPRWKGGRKILKNGYIKVWYPDSSMADSRGYVLEHRLFMAKSIGRDLRKNEEVHHIDHNPSNNSLDNLVLTNPKEHKLKYHMKEVMENLSKTPSHISHVTKS